MIVAEALVLHPVKSMGTGSITRYETNKNHIVTSFLTTAIQNSLNETLYRFKKNRITQYIIYIMQFHSGLLFSK